MSPTTLPARSRHRPPPSVDAPVLDVVVPVHNEELDLGPCVRRLHALPHARLPVPLPDHRRRQRQHRRTLAVAAGSGRGAAGVGRVHLTEKGRGRALQAVWSALGRAGARVHGRRPVAPTSTRCCRWSRRCSPATPTWRSAPGWRAAPGWCAARKREFISRGYNLLLRGHAAARLLRRAVRLQGDPHRRRRAAAAAGRGHRLVLRHRAAGPRRAGRAAHPRGAGRLGRRPGQPRRHRPDRRRRPSRHRPARPRPAQRPLPLASRCARSSAATPLPRPACRPALPAQLLRFAADRRAVDGGVPAAVRAAAAGCGARRRRTSRPCSSPRSATPRATAG